MIFKLKFFSLKMKRAKKPTFILKIDHNLVNNKYNFDLVSNINEHQDKQSHMRTSILDLSTSRDADTHAYSFLDESKQTHSCIVTMKNILSGVQLPQTTDIYCFWCKHGFKSSPIGCPVSYISNKVTKSYHSEITKDKYKITDNITKNRKNMIKNLMEKHNSQFEILDNHSHYFVVDGIFCSFNCCMSFINAHKNNDYYKLSETLLYTMYKDIFNKTIEKINPSPDWRLLTNFGGPLTIIEFRKSLNKIIYEDIDDYIVRAPSSRMIGKLYEKKIKF